MSNKQLDMDFQEVFMQIFNIDSEESTNIYSKDK